MIDGRIAILGLGLIGGSLGLALRRAMGDDHSGGASREIIGWDQSTDALALAGDRGAIDRSATSPAEAVRDAGLVIVAVPVLGVRDVLAAIAPALPPAAVVTDVASTKAAVCRWADEILPGTFIGGHPMAGSERSGMAAARADLFDGATYCLTPEPRAPATAIATVEEMVRAVGARPYRLSAAEHDRAVAAVSHLPFLLATALVEVTTGSAEWDLLRTVAATGYRDVSRLASGDPRMHSDICLTNADEIRHWLVQTAQILERLAAELDDAGALQQRFDHAKAARDALYRIVDVQGRGPED